MGRVKFVVDQKPEDVIADRSFEIRGAGFSSVGTFRGGGCWAVLSSGTAQVNRWTPNPSTFNGKPVNLIEKNPIGGEADTPNAPQGVDGNLVRYSSDRTSTTPVTVEPNDVLVKGKGLDFTPEEDRDGMIADYSSLFVLETEPGANDYAPSSLALPGRTTLTPHTADISAIIASLPSYDTVNQLEIPTFEFLENTLSLWSPFSAYDYPRFFMYQYATPFGISDDGGVNGNYGGTMIRTFNNACLALISDAFTTSQKERLGDLLIGFGLQMLELVKLNGANQYINGGHHQWFMGHVTLARHAIGEDMTTHVDDMKSCWSQIIQVTSADMADLVPHTDVNKPHPWRERDIIDIDTANNRVRVSVIPGGFDGDPSRVNFNGMDMIRKSDGARLNITAQSSTQAATDPIWLTLTGQPPGGDYAVNDVVTFDTPSGETIVSAGDYDWCGGGRPKMYQWNPMPGAVYREQVKTTGQTALAKALGITGDIELVYGYTKRVNDPANGMPDHHITVWEEDWWARHGATLFP